MKTFPTLISTWKERYCAPNICCSMGKVWHSHFLRPAAPMIKVCSLVAPHSLWIFTTSCREFHIRAFVINWGRATLGCKRNRCTCLNVKVRGGGWHVEWWWRSGRTDSHRGTKCSPCPLPHVHRQLHNLYLYASPLETVSAGVMYRFNRSFFFTFAHYWFTSMYRGNNTRCCKENEAHDLRRDLHVWPTPPRMHAAMRVWGGLHVCEREKVGELQRGEGGGDQ